VIFPLRVKKREYPAVLFLIGFDIHALYRYDTSVNPSMTTHKNEGDIPNYKDVLITII
jgi:hypothetical protein